MTSKDYRNTPYNKIGTDLAKKKRKIKKSLMKKGHRLTNYHSHFCNRHSKPNSEFRNIYNNKCAYCGLSINIISSSLFEIDHFICKKDRKTFKSNINDLNNIVLACYDCNHKKGGKYFNESDKKLFNVDNGSISNLYYRDQYYNILIRDSYKGNLTVQKFYKDMDFGNQLRRLDYLLDSMFDFYNKYKHELKNTGFHDCLLSLLEKRNLY